MFECTHDEIESRVVVTPMLHGNVLMQRVASLTMRCSRCGTPFHFEGQLGLVGSVEAAIVPQQIGVRWGMPDVVGHA